MTTTNQTPETPTPENPPANNWLDTVSAMVARLQYGSVQITVHDGRVTQVESTERTRFNTKTP